MAKIVDIYSPKSQKEFRKSLHANSSPHTHDLSTMVDALDVTAKKSRGQVSVVGYYALDQAGVTLRLGKGENSLALMDLQYNLRDGRYTWRVVRHGDDHPEQEL